MPVRTIETPEAKTLGERQGFAVNTEALFSFFRSVVQLCFDENLLERQSQLYRYHYTDHTPVKEGVEITLETIRTEQNPAQTTHVGNVEMIMHGVRICSGAQVGDGCIIKSRVHIGEGATIGNYALIEHNTPIGDHATLHEGAYAGTGVTIGDGAVLGEGCRVNYDQVIAANSKFEPYCEVG